MLKCWPACEAGVLKCSPCIRVPLCTALLARVELLQQRSRYLLHDRYLIGGEVFPPASWGRLAVELPLSLLFLRYVLPGVLLDRLREIFPCYLDPQRRVEALHGAEGIVA